MWMWMWVWAGDESSRCTYIDLYVTGIGMGMEGEYLYLGLDGSEIH